MIVLFRKSLLISICLINSVFSQQDSLFDNSDHLRSGLKQMISLLKTGEKDSALTWFRKNYYSLHKNNLLSDSVLLDLSSQIKTQPIDIKPDTLSLFQKDVRNNLHEFIKQELDDISKKLMESPQKLLPDDFIDDVEKYVKKFSENPNFHQFFQKSINRSRKYIPVIEEYFIQKGFPREILFE